MTDYSCGGGKALPVVSVVAAANTGIATQSINKRWHTSLEASIFPSFAFRPYLLVYPGCRLNAEQCKVASGYLDQFASLASSDDFVLVA
jgi:hypothetical protein